MVGVFRKHTDTHILYVYLGNIFIYIMPEGLYILCIYTEEIVHLQGNIGREY